MLETLIPGALLLSFRLTLPFHLLQRSFRFNSSRPFDTSFLSFQHSHPVHVLLPFVSFHVSQFLYNPFGYMFYCNWPISFVASFFKFQHSPTLVTSFLSFQLLLPFAVKSFISLRPSLRFTSFVNSFRCFFPFVSTLRPPTICSLL